MPIIKHVTSIATVPALLCHQASIQECAARGTILFYHGFTGTKETLEEQMNSLAQAGFLKCGKQLIIKWSNGFNSFCKYCAHSVKKAAYPNGAIDI